MMDFVKYLRETYGHLDINDILRRNELARQEKFSPPEEIPSAPKEFQLMEPTPPDAQDFQFEELSIDSEPNYSLNPYDTPTKKFFSPIIFPSTPKPSPGIVNIASLKDWVTLREDVLDLHELKNFFAGKSDSQSPMFQNTLEKYQRDVEKNLSSPREIDADSSANFVDKLADVIKKRFFTILKSCHNGLQGKGELPTTYYRELENRVRQYFKRIGLKSDNVKRLDNFKDCQERMNAIPAPVAHSCFDGKIDEIFIQPHFFEYHDDDGEVRKKWIDGECTVYKFKS